MADEQAQAPTRRTRRGEGRPSVEHVDVLPNTRKGESMRTLSESDGSNPANDAVAPVVADIPSSSDAKDEEKTTHLTVDDSEQDCTPRDGACTPRPPLADRLAVVLVGLPARGKTYLGLKLAYYLNWVRVSCKVFNLGKYRRKKLGPHTPSRFFDPSNAEGVHFRRMLCVDGVRDMLNFFDEGGVVGILDATNSTRERRTFVHDMLVDHGVDVFFVETVCDDDAQIHNNILQVKVGLPDYTAQPVQEAVADFRERIEYYKAKYQTMDMDLDRQLSFMKMIDVGRCFVVNNIKGYLETRIVRFLMTLHITPRVIYITRHGESEYNKQGLIGGDSALSENGRKYAERLKDFIDSEKLPEYKVWTSSLRRTMQTARHFDKFEAWKALDELDAGLCDELSYNEIKQQYPDLYEQRARDKYWTRYPRGESYSDLVQRLEPRIVELEREKSNLIVVCHQAVARCLLAYFLAIKDLEDQLPYLEVPLHTVFKITPIPYGNRIEKIPLGIDAVSTHRPRETIVPGAINSVQPDLLASKPESKPAEFFAEPDTPSPEEQQSTADAIASGGDDVSSSN